MVLFSSAQQLHQDDANAVFGSAVVVPDSPDHSLNHDSPSDSNNESPSPAPSVVGDILTINGQVRSQIMPMQSLTSKYICSMHKPKSHRSASSSLKILLSRPLLPT